LLNCERSPFNLVDGIKSTCHLVGFGDPTSEPGKGYFPPATQSTLTLTFALPSLFHSFFRCFFFLYKTTCRRPGSFITLAYTYIPSLAARLS
jgi:hypothetical protein